MVFIGNLTVFTAVKIFGDRLRSGEVTTISCWFTFCNIKMISAVFYV